MREIEQVVTTRAPQPVEGAPYSQAVRFRDLVFVSGQLGVNADTGKLVAGGVTEEAEQALQNLSAVLDEAGSNIGNLLKVTVAIRSRDDWAAMNGTYARFVGNPPPARTTLEVGRLAHDARIEIDCVAYVDEKEQPMDP